jgi:hypothetical protein
MLDTSFASCHTLARSSLRVSLMTVIGAGESQGSLVGETYLN